MWWSLPVGPGAVARQSVQYHELCVGHTGHASHFYIVVIAGERGPEFVKKYRSSRAIVFHSLFSQNSNLDK